MSEGLEWPHFGSGELGRPLLAKASVPLWASIMLIDPGLGQWTRSLHRRQQVGGTPRTQEPPSPTGKQPPPRSDFLMLSTERDGERQTQTETRSETETERQAGREAERKAPLSQRETPQECTQRPRGQGPGGGTHFPAACPPGLTQLSDCPASRPPLEGRG